MHARTKSLDFLCFVAPIRLSHPDGRADQATSLPIPARRKSSVSSIFYTDDKWQHLAASPFQSLLRPGEKKRKTSSASSTFYVEHPDLRPQWEDEARLQCAGNREKELAGEEMMPRGEIPVTVARGKLEEARSMRRGRADTRREGGAVSQQGRVVGDSGTVRQMTCNNNNNNRMSVSWMFDAGGKRAATLATAGNVGVMLDQPDRLDAGFRRLSLSAAAPPHQRRSEKIQRWSKRPRRVSTKSGSWGATIQSWRKRTASHERTAQRDAGGDKSENDRPSRETAGPIKDGACDLLALAVSDSRPSPYDTEGLAFRAGDWVEILARQPNGIWQGKANGKVGNFKFIHVQILEDEFQHQIKSLKFHANTSLNSLLRMADLPQLIPMLSLHGYDTLRDLLILSPEKYEYLGVNREHREKIRQTISQLIGDEADSVLTGRCSSEASSVEDINDADSGISEDASSISLSEDTKSEQEDNPAGSDECSSHGSAVGGGPFLSLPAKDGTSDLRTNENESFLYHYININDFQTIVVHL